MSMHHQGSVSAMEGYNSRRCHLGARHHSATISSSQALRTRIFFKRGGGGGGGNVRDLTSLTPHIGRIIYFLCNK
jgi:hypothetical protein